MLSSATRPRPRLDILPETRYVVFNGDEHSAEPFKLRGSLRLTLPESINIKAVSVRLKCEQSISIFTAQTGPQQYKQRKYNEHKDLGATRTSHKANKGVVHWPFEFAIAPDANESVEGLRDETWMRWQLSAVVERAGWNAKNIVATCDIRVVRTLGPDQLESTRSRVNQDIWGNKVSYSVSIPTDAVVFGTSIPATLELSPLRKGLEFGKVEVKLYETIIKRIPECADRQDDEYYVQTIKDENEVASTTLDFPHESAVTFGQDNLENPTMEDERYLFNVKLALPKSLSDCRQDVEQFAIHITHRIKILVNIINPEGHTSQLVCRLPVKLYISPFLPINDNHSVQPSDGTPSESELNNIASSAAAPPVYGSHLLDELYSDLRPYLMSTTASAVATPYAGLSRTGSSENLAQAMQALDGVTEAPAGQLNHALLEYRLANLPASPRRRETNSPRLQGYSAPETPYRATGFDNAEISSQRPRHENRASISSASGRDSTTPLRSRPSSGDLTVSTPPVDGHDTVYNMGTLSRVPSYDAALRTMAAPLTETPPSYLEATSRPPSPGFQHRSLNALATDVQSEIRSTSHDSASTMDPISGLPAMQIVAPSPLPESATGQFLPQRLDGTSLRP